VATDPNDPTTTEDEHQPVLDRVQEVSKKADGTPDQMEGFEVIEDPEADAEKAARARQASPEEATTRRRRTATE
jgi:hypothetical protein